MPPRKRAEKPVEAAPEQPSEVVSTPPEPAAEAAPLSPPSGDDSALAAPLTPPAATPDPSDSDPPVLPEDGLVTLAAPLTPPAAPAAAPLAPPTPEPPMGQTAMPGSAFVDFVDEAGKPIDPDTMFVDPGARYTYVRTACRITRVHRQDGATTRTSDQLLYPAGRRLDRAEAAKLRAELESIRASRSSAEE
ncbi:hypothetical protein ABT352_33490 [Streptosporangium sp. NPDC000563]|uniref:hypothetical protein n=1 Tax=Streptosporangium sp. NPDC000563 TaxID=3154366 RepID=UPI003322FBC2